MTRRSRPPADPPVAIGPYLVEACRDPLELWRVIYPDGSRAICGSKAEALRHASIRNACEAAMALLEHEREVAETSYRTWTGSEWVFNDDIWDAHAPDQFARIKRLREALAHVHTPGSRPGG